MGCNEELNDKFPKTKKYPEHHRQPTCQCNECKFIDGWNQCLIAQSAYMTPIEWFTTANPLLGDVSPIEMIKNCRGDKLCNFILNCIDENSESGKSTKQEDNRRDKGLVSMDGQAKCEYCKGTGQILHSNSLGSGYLRCHYCNGKPSPSTCNHKDPVARCCENGYFNEIHKCLKQPPSSSISKESCNHPKTIAHTEGNILHHECVYCKEKWSELLNIKSISKEQELDNADEVIAFAIALYEARGYPKNSFEMLDYALSHKFCQEAEILMQDGYSKRKAG